MNLSAATQARTAIRKWRAEPVTFVREVLRVETIDAWQEEVLLAATTHQRIALKASKGPGKSTVLAWLGWWFLLTRPFPKVVGTSVSGDNLRDGLWSELAKWQNNSPLLKAAFQWSAERIFAKDHPETWWASARQWARGADATQQANTLAGIHADYVMFLVDEAGAIPDGVVAAAEAGLANADPARDTEALLVLAGNPTHLDGPLYRACTRERALWFVKEISGDPDDPKRAPRVSIEWARQQIAKYGRENPWVLINVFGKFPPGQSNTLLGIEECVAAAQRGLMESDYREEVKVVGVDVARFGDDETVIARRQGRAAFVMRHYRNIDTTQTAGEVQLVIDKWEPDAVFIDTTGGIGAGVFDQLKARGYPMLIAVEFAGKPSDSNYLNKRAEMWLRMAAWLKQGGCIPDDSVLLSELPGPTYKITPAGKFQLESKEDMKKRGLPSPNRADALACTFAHSVARRSLRETLARAGKPRAVIEYDPYAGD